MITKETIIELIDERYNVQPDFPWEKHPSYAVFRHQRNNKWFLLLMNISADKLGINTNDEIQVINVKVSPEYIGPLREKTGFYPAYHMNKSYWISINLNEVSNVEEIESFIMESFDLTL